MVRHRWLFSPEAFGSMPRTDNSCCRPAFVFICVFLLQVWFYVSKRRGASIDPKKGSPYVRLSGGSHDTPFATWRICIIGRIPYWDLDVSIDASSLLFIWRRYWLCESLFVSSYTGRNSICHAPVGAQCLSSLLQIFTQTPPQIYKPTTIWCLQRFNAGYNFHDSNTSLRNRKSGSLQCVVVYGVWQFLRQLVDVNSFRVHIPMGSVISLPRVWYTGRSPCTSRLFQIQLWSLVYLVW